jgi:tetratricopeptide (TPR) repeat protein
VWVGRALEFDDKNHVPDQVGAYLGLLEKYDPAKLDPGSLLQLVRALEQAAPPALAAKAGQAGLLTDRSKLDDLSGLLVAREVGPLFRYRLDDPEAAQTFWQGAAKVLGPDQWKAECEVEAADILLNDLLRPADAKPLLEAATGRRGAIDTATVASHLERVRGDWSARQGDRAAALAAYAKATTALGDQRNVAAQEAWRGALSRSTEAYLRDKDLDRARDELRRWQDEFPADKVQGYLPLLQARLLAARGKMAGAVAMAGDLLTVNPESPYADRILFLAADCEERRGRPDAARARLQSLLSDYPGSPLVTEAKTRIARIDAKRKAAAPAPVAPKPTTNSK